MWIKVFIGIQHIRATTTKDIHKADSRFAPSQWEMALLCNDVSYWLGTSLESVLNTLKIPLLLIRVHFTAFPVLIHNTIILMWSCQTRDNLIHFISELHNNIRKLLYCRFVKLPVLREADNINPKKTHWRYITTVKTILPCIHYKINKG